MTNMRQKRLMQEALDDNLTQEDLSRLRENLDDAAADEFSRLRQVDRMLKTAPHERAPRSLALKIMQRLAESIKPEQLTRLSGLALALSLTLVAALLLPLMIGVGWLLLTAISSAGALNVIIQQIVSLLALGISLMEWFAGQVQNIITANPGLPLLMAGVIPLSIIWLLRFVPRRSASEG